MTDLKDMSVEELAALCGLKRDEQGDWVGKLPWAHNPSVLYYRLGTGLWCAYGKSGMGLQPRNVTEHEALLILAKHLNAAPPASPKLVPFPTAPEPEPPPRSHVAAVRAAIDAWREDMPHLPADVNRTCGEDIGRVLARAYLMDAKK